MIPIAIRIDAGGKLCKNCHLKRWSYRDWECPAFQETLNVDENLGIVRLPQCLAAESDLKRLVAAARALRSLIYINPVTHKAYLTEAAAQGKRVCDATAEALKPFEED